MEKLEDIEVPKVIKNFGEDAVKTYLGIRKSIKVPEHVQKLGDEAINFYLDTKAFLNYPSIKRQLQYSLAARLINSK